MLNPARDQRVPTNKCDNHITTDIYSSFADHDRLDECLRGVQPHSNLAIPGTSGYIPPTRVNPSPQKETPEELADKILKEAEGARAQIFDVPGKQIQNPQSTGFNLNQEFVHSMWVDEKYCSVASHVDPLIKERIIRGQYVDFSKLIPKDRIQMEESAQKMQLVMKGGNTFFIPASDNVTVISNIQRWDQAFRVFSEIYCRQNVNRSTELIQYSHVIHSAASTYVWDNVYAYDKDFRLHIAENPGRSWAILLHQARAMRLRERIRPGDFNRQHYNDRNKNNNSKDYCKHYNKGRCTFGSRCKYEHRCSYCHKPGHGLFNCRKLAADKKEKEAVSGNTVMGNVIQESEGRAGK